MSDKKRAAVFHSRDTYTFFNYLAYALYAPLYIAGPVITFNDFVWQVGTHHPVIPFSLHSSSYVQLARPTDIAPRATARYGLRFLISLLTMETLIHIMHVVAIKDTRAWSGMTPAQLSMLGFWNLIFVWLKVCHSISVQTTADQVSGSCFCLGDSFAYGRLWMGWTRPRTWCAAWRITTHRSASGARGTVRTTSGSCATSTFRLAGRIGSLRRAC